MVFPQSEHTGNTTHMQTSSIICADGLSACTVLGRSLTHYLLKYAHWRLMDAHWGLMNACCRLVHSTWDTIGAVCLHVTAFQFVMQGAYVSVDAPDHALRPCTRKA